MGIEAQGKMVEQVDLDDKKEDKAANEVVDNVLANTVHGTVAGQGELKSQKFSKATPPKMFRLTKIN